MISYHGARRPPRGELIEAHRRAWEQIGEPGTWWHAANRVAMIDESRSARACKLCSARALALSPASVQGQHDRRSNLDPIVVDLALKSKPDTA